MLKITKTNKNEVPSYFNPKMTSHGTDLFHAFGEAKRPDYRWLIAGNSWYISFLFVLVIFNIIFLMSFIYLFVSSSQKWKSCQMQYHIMQYILYLFLSICIPRRVSVYDHLFKYYVWNIQSEARTYVQINTLLQWRTFLFFAGPARSGSIFHIDPNQTNAWNVCKDVSKIGG